jgi:hypothetical protein
MPTLKVGNTEVTDVSVGNTEVQEVYSGSNKVWERGYSAVMTTGYNSHIYTGSNTTHYEAGWAYYSTLPFSSPNSMGSPVGSLSNQYVELGNGIEEVFLLRCTWTGNQSSSKTLHLTLMGLGSNYTNNGGWETLKIGGFTFSRSSGSFNGVQGFSLNSRRWSWTTPTNPFGSTRGATKNISIA